MTFTPGVVEPSFGIDRILFSVLEHSYYARPKDFEFRQGCRLGGPIFCLADGSNSLDMVNWGSLSQLELPVKSFNSSYREFWIHFDLRRDLHQGGV